MREYLMLFCMCIGGCSAAQSPEVCAAPKLAAVEAAYFSEAVDRCAEHTWEQCPYRAELTEKYDAARSKAVEACQ